MTMNNVRNITNFTKNSKKGEDNMNKVGAIYKNIANECLIAWYPDMSDTERDNLLERGNLQEIESYVGAKNSIDTAVEAVREDLERYQVYLPDDFSYIVYYSDMPNGEAERITLEIGKNRAIDENTKVSIAIHALDKIHRRWIDDNTKKFFDEKRRGKRYMFLPIEFIGWDEVLKDYVFLSPILQLLGIRAETCAIQEAYAINQEPYMGKLGVTKCKNVAFLEIRESLLRIEQDITDEEVKEVVEQVVSRCPAFNNTK